MLLVILALNIALIVFYEPDDETICPIAFNYTSIGRDFQTFFDFSNSSNESSVDSLQLSPVNEGFSSTYVALVFLLGFVFAVLTVWMLLEYYVVTWPHFVLPKFLYTLCKKLAKYAVVRWPIW